MSKREYKSGLRWAFWRWTFTPSGYITRLHIIKTPWFAVCLHYINKPDPEACLHDHPVTFLSLILRGGYTELRTTWGSNIVGIRRHRRYNFIRATPDDRHTIVSVKPHTVTLALMGPKTREWGFHTPDGWVHWKSYNDAKYRRKS